MTPRTETLGRWTAPLGFTPVCIEPPAGNRPQTLRPAERSATILCTSQGLKRDFRA